MVETPLFERRKIIKDLSCQPGSKIKRQQVKTALSSHLEDYPEDLIFLQRIYERIKGRSSSNLEIEKLFAKHDIEIKVEQEIVTKLKEMNSELGKIKIDVNQKQPHVTQYEYQYYSVDKDRRYISRR